jgi:hypothetical protein
MVALDDEAHRLVAGIDRDPLRQDEGAEAIVDVIGGRSLARR